MSKRVLWLVFPVLLAGCGDDPGEPPRVVTASVAVGADGVSEPVELEVPPGTRSLSIVARGGDADLLALASFELGGVERVGIALDGSHRADMQAQYVDEQIGHMPGDLYQTIRLGTFAHVYPYAPGQTVDAGPASLRIATTATAGTVDVEIVMREDDGASVLHVNLIAVSDAVTLEASPSFLAEAVSILAAGGIDVVVDEVVNAADTSLANITDFSEPQENPGSMSAQLARYGSTLVSGDGLNVFVVDELPFGVAGLSLGTPGPADPGSYYFGVVLRYVSEDALLARVFAHEVAHFLALQHLENRGISGAIYPDPLDDTDPSVSNLMESGTALTAGQAFALSRSALLELE